MGDFGDFVEFFFKLKQIDLKTKEIQQREILASREQGINQQLLLASAESGKQTLEVIKLTRVIVFLTIGLFIIGIVQIIITLAK